MALMFFPRGGSAQVVKYVARNLPDSGWEPTIVVGSAKDEADATKFYDGLDVRSVDYAPALQADDSLRADRPLHPSFEDREDAPDRVFAKVDDETYEHLVSAWEEHLRDAGAADADL